MKKIAILQSNYIPWKGYFDIIASVDEFILYDDVQFTKNDWRNRNKIKTQNGLQWLSIPVGADINRRIRDVELKDRQIWRLNGNVYQAVAESKMLSISKGINKIHIDKISARKGDFLGLFMKTSEIDRSLLHREKTRIYALGDAKEIPKDTKARDAQTGYTFSVLGIWSEQTE